MVGNFLEYLCNKYLISSQHADFVSDYVQTGASNYTLFAKHCFNFSQDQIKEVCNYITDFPSAPFELAAHKLGFLDDEQINFFTQRKDELDYVHGQLLVDLNFLDLNTVCEELLFYKIESSHSENIVDMPSHTKKFTDAFLDKYVQIVSNRIKKSFDENVLTCRVEILSEVKCDVFVYQELLSDFNITTGFVFDFDLISSSNFRFINSLSQDNESISADEEDFTDYMCEFLNNINGACTYSFSTEFDLAVPMHLEKVTVQSPLIYSIDFAFSSQIIKLLVIPESDYFFTQEVN